MSLYIKYSTKIVIILDIPNNFKHFLWYLYDMRMLITEKQLSSILRKKKQMKKDVEEANDITSTSSSSTPAPSTTSSASSPTSSTASTAATPAGAATSTDDIGSSPSSDDYTTYPGVGHWESGVTRGAANQIATKSNWSDVVGSKLTRGKANPLK